MDKTVPDLEPLFHLVDHHKGAHYKGVNMIIIDHHKGARHHHHNGDKGGGPTKKILF